MLSRFTRKPQSRGSVRVISPETDSISIRLGVLKTEISALAETPSKSSSSSWPEKQRSPEALSMSIEPILQSVMSQRPLAVLISTSPQLSSRRETAAEAASTSSLPHSQSRGRAMCRSFFRLLPRFPGLLLKAIFSSEPDCLTSMGSLPWAAVSKS